MMKNSRVRLEDIACYLPYGLKGRMYGSVIVDIDSNFVKTHGFDFDGVEIILRRGDKLFNTVTHGNQEVVPIVECAKAAYPEYDWELGSCFAWCDNGFEIVSIDFENMSFRRVGGGALKNQHKMFAKLDELKLDYKGLIEKGFAIDSNRLDEKVYF